MGLLAGVYLEIVPAHGRRKDRMAVMYDRRVWVAFPSSQVSIAAW